MPFSNAQNCKNYRDRKKNLNCLTKIHSTQKSNAEYCRMYRLWKQMPECGPSPLPETPAQIIHDPIPLVVPPKDMLEISVPSMHTEGPVEVMIKEEPIDIHMETVGALCGTDACVKKETVHQECDVNVIPESSSLQMSNQEDRCGSVKRDSEGKFINFLGTEEIEVWLQQLREEKEFSDVDCSGEDTEYEIEDGEERVNQIQQFEESESDSNHSEDDTGNTPLVALAERTEKCGGTISHYIGKNGFLWSKTPVNRTTVLQKIEHVSQPTEELAFHSFVELWSKIFDPEMITNVVRYTNEKLGMYRQKFQNTDRQELKETTHTEIRSLIGLLYYTSVLKCNSVDANYLFATDGTGHEIFRSVMSKYRFYSLINCLRFDNANNRAERLKSDPLAAVSWLFDKFVANSKKSYNLGPNACVDAMVIPFRGRCKFIVNMPKSAKYGLKVVILSDSDTHYVHNTYIFCGKGSDGKDLSVEEKKLSASTQSVLRVSKPIENSNRTADNRFSSMQLMEILKAKNLTFLGTLDRKTREIPPEFQANKTRETGSCLYGFSKDYTLLSYVPKKNKAVILISSSHHVASIDEATQKPMMILDYHSKIGEIYNEYALYSCARKTRRWPMAIFYRLLDLSALNSFVLYQNCENSKLRRGDFTLSLARDLVLPALKERVYNNRLPRELRLTIQRVLGNDLPQPQPQPEGPSGRKLCSICPSRLKRQTRFSCCACKKPICLQCASQLCEDCKF